MICGVSIYIVGFESPVLFFLFFNNVSMLHFSGEDPNTGDEEAAGFQQNSFIYPRDEKLQSIQMN